MRRVSKKCRSPSADVASAADDVRSFGYEASASPAAAAGVSYANPPNTKTRPSPAAVAVACDRALGASAAAVRSGYRSP